jgi:hypothetical protein
MKRAIALGLPFLVFFSAGVLAQDSVPLPVRKVVLYKNGIGYFEHMGPIKGAQTVEIVLPSTQLNDVLKSLTVLDLGHGRIAGVHYDSAAPLDRRLAELPISLGAARGLVAFLNQIRGAGVEIRAPGGVISGKLMEAESRTRSAGQGVTTEFVQVTVFGSSGEVRIVDLESAGALKLTAPALAADLNRYLDLLDTGNQRDVRRLRIEAAGSGDRQLYVSYTAEAPIWKATYRIVLDPKQKPLLQGWAIVDNTTLMDWTQVSLSLVAGAPISFVQNLSQPLYARRPVIPLPEGLQVSPQVHEATLEEPKPAGAQETVGMLAAAPPPPAPARMMRMEASRPAPAPAQEPAGMDLAKALREQSDEPARAREVGEQFEYRLTEPISIRRNESALLPILHSEVDGEKVAVFSATSGERHPRLAFWLKNSSGATLDAGSFSVIDTNAFAGEGLFETIQPGESRLLSYAIDLGTEISSRSGSERRRVERIQIARGILRMQAKMVEKKTYLIRNNNDKLRAILIEHPVRANWQLTETAAPVESAAGSYRFRIEAKPKTTTDFSVSEESLQETTFMVSNVTPDQIALWVKDRSIDPETEKLLRNIATRKAELNDIVQRIAALDREQAEIFRDQERVRGNLQRLGQSPEEAALRQRYIREMDQQENRLTAIRTEHAKLDSSRSALQAQIDELVQGLNFDRKL